MAWTQTTTVESSVSGKKYKPAGESTAELTSVVIQGQTIQLDAQFYDRCGTLADPTNLTLTIQNPSQNTVVTLTSTNIVKQDIGKYYYLYSVASNATAGGWKAIWKGKINGEDFIGRDKFTVITNTDTVENKKGLVYFENDFKCKCGDLLRVYLKDIDERNYAFAPFEISLLLDGALSDMNTHPTFTDFEWVNVPSNWMHPLALGGQVQALWAQSLIESGKEYTITDQGISFNPPGLSAAMQAIAGAISTKYEALKESIKSNIKPPPQGIGTFRVLQIAPAFLKLRHLRERRIF